MGHMYINSTKKEITKSSIIRGILALAFIRVLILVLILVSALLHYWTSRLLSILGMLPLGTSLPMRVEGLQISIALVERLEALL